MKILNTNQFISERMKIVPINNDELDKVKTYNYYPKTKEELQSIIKERIKEEGNECDMNDIDVSKITDMSELFANMDDFNGDISEWNVSNVIDMQDMFYDAESFNQDISRWDVSNVVNMKYMFYYAKSFNQDISKWDVSNVTDMYNMFYYAKSFNHDISEWDVSRVTNMGLMFGGCPLENNPPSWYKE